MVVWRGSGSQILVEDISMRDLHLGEMLAARNEFLLQLRPPKGLFVDRVPALL